MSYFDRTGKPIGMVEWSNLFQDKSYQIVQQDRVDPTEEQPEGRILVSTVWLGLDHNFGGGTPLIFETMVFGGILDQECDRYPTEEQALAGHEKMLEQVKGLIVD